MTQRDRAEKEQEHRQKVITNFKLINKEYEHKSIEAIGQCHKEIEQKVEEQLKAEAEEEIKRFRRFKNYMQECEQKRMSKIEIEEMEAVSATQHLCSLQEKLTARSLVAEQRLKEISDQMQHRTAKSLMGHERNSVLQETFLTRRAEGVLKKEKGNDKRRKVSSDFIEDKLHFIKNKKSQYLEQVSSGKQDAHNQALEKLHRIRDRRNQKEQLKLQVLQ